MSFLKRLFRRKPRKIGVSLEVVDKFTPRLDRIIQEVERSIQDSIMNIGKPSADGWLELAKAANPNAKVERIGDEIHITETFIPTAPIEVITFNCLIDPNAIAETQHGHVTSTGGCIEPCGMNYCDENGCASRKRHNVNGTVTGPPFSDNTPPTQKRN